MVSRNVRLGFGTTVALVAGGGASLLAGCGVPTEGEQVRDRASAQTTAGDHDPQPGDAESDTVRAPQSVGGCAEPASPWQAPPLPTGTLDALRAHIEDVASTLVGSWRGTVTTPWVEPYPVAFSYSADGHYASHCLAQRPGGCVAFYYGTDADSPIKQLRLTDATVFGKISGEIDIGFSFDGKSFYLPGWQGRLKDLEIDASGQRLRFAFSTSDGYGPVQFDLWRCEP